MADIDLSLWNELNHLAIGSHPLLDELSEDELKRLKPAQPDLDDEIPF